MRSQKKIKKKVNDKSARKVFQFAVKSELTGFGLLIRMPWWMACFNWGWIWYFSIGKYQHP